MILDIAIALFSAFAGFVIGYVAAKYSHPIYVDTLDFKGFVVDELKKIKDEFMKLNSSINTKTNDTAKNVDGPETAVSDSAESATDTVAKNVDGPETTVVDGSVDREPDTAAKNLTGDAATTSKSD